MFRVPLTESGYEAAVRLYLPPEITFDTFTSFPRPHTSRFCDLFALAAAPCGLSHLSATHSLFVVHPISGCRHPRRHRLIPLPRVLRYPKSEVCARLRLLRRLRHPKHLDRHPAPPGQLLNSEPPTFSLTFSLTISDLRPPFPSLLSLVAPSPRQVNPDCVNALNVTCTSEDVGSFQFRQEEFPPQATTLHLGALR